MKVACVSESKLDLIRADRKFSLFSSTENKGVGAIGIPIQGLVARKGLVPSVRAWDLMAICLSAIGADHAVTRRKSPDGWTREIELVVSVIDHDFWSEQSKNLEKTFSFLTGDLWSIQFVGDGAEFFKPSKRSLFKQESVSLLSGGLDSLIGGIDQVADGRRPLLVSQVSTGDKEKQKYFANHLKCEHIQLPQSVHAVSEQTEGSTRARSLAFFSYGILVATCLERYGNGGGVDLIVPENGYISLNVPFTPMRIGSLNTKTTHPVFVRSLQEVLNAAEIRVSLRNPHQFDTKGEMMANCGDQELLKSLASQSSSCGKGGRIHMHCGRCVPCLVRRSAFFVSGFEDETKYMYSDLSKNDKNHLHYDDVKSAWLAIQRLKKVGVEKWAGSAISSALLGGNVSDYYSVAERGLKEIERFL